MVNNLLEPETHHLNITATPPRTDQNVSKQSYSSSLTEPLNTLLKGLRKLDKARERGRQVGAGGGWCCGAN